MEYTSVTLVLQHAIEHLADEPTRLLTTKSHKLLPKDVLSLKYKLPNDKMSNLDEDPDSVSSDEGMALSSSAN